MYNGIPGQSTTWLFTQCGSLSGSVVCICRFEWIKLRVRVCVCKRLHACLIRVCLLCVADDVVALSRRLYVPSEITLKFSSHNYGSAVAFCSWVCVVWYSQSEVHLHPLFRTFSLLEPLYSSTLTVRPCAFFIWHLFVLEALITDRRERTSIFRKIRTLSQHW